MNEKEELLKIIETYDPSHVLKMYNIGVDMLEGSAWSGFYEACSFLKLTELEIENLSSDFKAHLNDHIDQFFNGWVVAEAVHWVLDKTGRNDIDQDQYLYDFEPSYFMDPFS